MTFSDFRKLFIWEVINPFILSLKKRKKYKVAKNIKGINIGCGFDNPENWIGLDGHITNYILSKSPKFIVKRVAKKMVDEEEMGTGDFVNKILTIKLKHFDLRYGLPFKNETVPNIYSSHFIEHVFKKEAKFIFEECFRVLKPNGIIRINVPSLDAAVENIKEAISEYENGSIKEIQEYVTSQIVGFHNKYSSHKWMHNFDEMKNIMQETGFQNIEQREMKLGNIPDVEILDVRTGLIVEAQKL